LFDVFTEQIIDDDDDDDDDDMMTSPPSSSICLYWYTMLDQTSTVCIFHMCSKTQLLLPGWQVTHNPVLCSKFM